MFPVSFITFFFHFSFHLFVHLFCFSRLFLLSHFSILYLCMCFSFSFMTEDNTRHPEKWVKAVVRMVRENRRTNVWKGGLLLACFWAWLKVWVDGPDSTRENALAHDFRLGWAALVCFLWLSDLCVTQTARGTPASERLSPSPYVFSLSTLIFSSCLPSSLNTCQKVTGKIGQLEAARLNLEDSMVCVEDQRKKIVLLTPIIGERQLHDMEEKTNKLGDRVTAALVIYEEHMSDYHTRLILILHMAWAKNQIQRYWKEEFAKALARGGCTLATFWNGNGFTERRWGVGGKEMMKCGIDGRAQKMKRTRKEAKWKQRTRRDRSVMSRVGHFAHGPAHVQKKKTVVVPQIQYIAVCDATTCSPNSECSETVEDLQNAIQPMEWSMSLSWCIGFFFFHHKKIDWVPHKTLWRTRLHV